MIKQLPDGRFYDETNGNYFAVNHFDNFSQHYMHKMIKENRVPQMSFPHVARAGYRSSNAAYVNAACALAADENSTATKSTARTAQPSIAASSPLHSLSLEQLQKINAEEDERAMKREAKAQVSQYVKAYHPNDNKSATLTERQSYLLSLTPLGQAALKQNNK